MKKFFTLLGIVLLLGFSTVVNVAVADSSRRPSDYRIGIPYSSAISSNKPAVILFYADWCGYCRMFMPIFSSVYQTNNFTYNFSMVDIDKNESLFRSYGQRGVPRVYIVDKVNNKRYLIPNKYYGSVSELNGILNEYLRRRNSRSL